MGALTGKTAKKQARLAERAQAEQRAMLEEERRKVASVEAGQKRVREGAGRGLVAFIEDRLAGTFGGG